MNMTDHLNNSFDAEFTEALKNGLTWFPWVGKHYPSSEHKLLIVGESHYSSERDLSKAPQDVNALMKDSQFTREVVWNLPVTEDWGDNSMFRNLHKALMKTQSFDRFGFWQELSFYNFVQRPMTYSVRERPSPDDFFDGWRVFIDILKILKPAACVLVGVSASNSFNEAMAAMGIDHRPITWKDSLNNIYLRTPASVSINGVTTEIFFIKHTSQYFSWEQWNTYLTKQIPRVIARLEKLFLTDADTKIKDDVLIPVGQTNTKGIPTHLAHKPIIACNYGDITDHDDSDAKFISIGHAQYNHECASVKIWRQGDSRWSRQSEEVPIERIGYMMQMLLKAIQVSQGGSSVSQSSLKEEIISLDDLDFITREIHVNRDQIVGSIKEIKNMIDALDLEKI